MVGDLLEVRRFESSTSLPFLIRLLYFQGIERLDPLHLTVYPFSYYHFTIFRRLVVVLKEVDLY